MVTNYLFSTQSKFERKNLETQDLPAALADPAVFVWVDLENPTAEETKKVLEETFHFHQLSIEDCTAVSQAPKVEEYSPQNGDGYPAYLFLILHAVDYNHATKIFATSDLDFFLGKNFLVTYHKASLRAIASVKERCIHGAKGIALAPDRLANALLDGLVESYKPALEEMAAEIANVEQKVFQNPNPKALPQILQLKKRVMHLRRVFVAQRDVVGRLAAGEFGMIQPRTVHYYRNVYDALLRVADVAQSYADSLIGILQVYLNLASNQTGEVVKVLTLITVITTPLMVIGTWYGMNFKDMPELQSPHGYLYATLAMVTSTALTVWYFKKKRWL